MRLDYTIVHGDTRTFYLEEVLDPDGMEYDYSGATVVFNVQDLFSKDLSAGIDQSSGNLLLTVEPADTEDSPDQRVAYPYDLTITLADGTVNTPQRGLFIVLPHTT